MTSGSRGEARNGRGSPHPTGGRYWHRVQSLKEVGTYLVSRGIPPAQVLRSNDLPASLLLDPGAWVERTVCFRLLADIARRTRDPYLGLHVAEVQRLQDYGPWGEGVLRAPTLGRALQFAAERIRLIRTGLTIHMRVDGDQVRLAAGFSGVSDAAALHPSLACMMTLYRIVLLAVEPAAVEARLCLSKQRSTEEAERLLGPRLAFAVERNELVFDRQALDLPLRPLTPAECEVNGLLRTGRPLATARETHRLIRDLLQSGRTTLVDVANALHMSVRGLQRHLDQWGVTFETMLDEYRRTSALDQLVDSELTVTEIAFGLGYSDPSHFTRAVRRWTGRTPRQIRLNPGPAPAWRKGPNPETAARDRRRTAG